MSKLYSTDASKSTTISALRSSAYRGGRCDAIEGDSCEGESPVLLCEPPLRRCDCASPLTLERAAREGLILCRDMPWHCPHEKNTSGGHGAPLPPLCPGSCNTGANGRRGTQLKLLEEK